ncbi:unnamed protein product, partial [Medioppia subpectinata]
MDTSRWPEVYFWLIMGGAFVANIANGIFQSCVYGIAAKLPVRYTNGVTIGFNLSGVIAAVFMIVSISVSQNDRVVAIYLFSFAIAYQMLCFLVEMLVRRNKFYQYYMINYGDGQLTNNDVEIIKGCNDIDKTSKTGVDMYLYVFCKIWLLLVNIIVTYFITYSLFPSLQANIKPVGRIIADKYFSPIFCFLLFPVFNTIGNYLAEVSAKPSETLLTVLSLLRLSFIPFFLLCNYYPYDRHMSVLVANDWVYIAGAISMAVTSGYLSSICIMYCPVGVEPRYASLAGMMASFSILFGILLGFTFSLCYPLILRI